MKIFVDEKSIESGVILGENAHYISKVLRVKIGDKIILGGENLAEHYVEICEITKNEVRFDVLKSCKNENEPGREIVLFQCLPKGDKFDDVIKKSVELGVFEVVPVLSGRCVSRPNVQSAVKKVARWNAISKNAAQQSRRGVVPKVREITGFNEAIEQMKVMDLSIVFYESGGENIKQILNNSVKSIAILIGPEGGFSADEIEMAKSAGVNVASLGKRILRCETAPIAALSIICHEIGEM